IPNIAGVASGFQRPPVSSTRARFARVQRSSESTRTPSRSKATTRIPTAATLSPILHPTNGMRPLRATGPLLRRLYATRTGVAAGIALAALALLCGLAIGEGGGAADGVAPLQSATAAPARGRQASGRSENRAAQRRHAQEHTAI